MWSEGREIVDGKREVKELGRRVYGSEGENEERKVNEGKNKNRGRVVKEGCGEGRGREVKEGRREVGEAREMECGRRELKSSFGTRQTEELERLSGM